MPSNKTLSEIVKGLKADKKRLEKDCEEYAGRILEVVEEKKVNQDVWIKQVTTLEDSRITKDQMIEKQRTEISELKKSVRISKDYIRMLLQEDITEHRINVVYNIEG